MFGNKNTIRQAMAAVDADIGTSISDMGHALSEFASDIPLKGLSAESMLNVEKRGLELCRARLTDIEAEISRLMIEKASTSAIIGAAVAKVTSLEAFLRPPNGAPLKPEVPPAQHTDIRTDRVKAAPVKTAVMPEAATLELDIHPPGAVSAFDPVDEK